MKTLFFEFVDGLPKGKKSVGSRAIFLRKFLRKSLEIFTKYIQNFKLNSEFFFRALSSD